MNALSKLSAINIICISLLSACAAVYTDASDSNHVTFLNSSGESIEQLSKKASAYCEQYGKVASYRSSDTQMVAVFDCKATRWANQALGVLASQVWLVNQACMLSESMELNRLPPLLGNI